MKMPDVILVMHLDIAPIVVRILELPLDQQIGAVNIIRILLRFEHGLVVVAEDRMGYIVGVKAHSSPRRVKRPSLSGGPAARSDLCTAAQTVVKRVRPINWHWNNLGRK